MAEQRMRTVVIPLAPNTTRAELRRICARIHDMAAVVAVEVDADQRSIRVMGDMGVDELRAAIGGRSDDVVC